MRPWFWFFPASFAVAALLVLSFAPALALPDEPSVASPAGDLPPQADAPRWRLRFYHREGCLPCLRAKAELEDPKTDLAKFVAGVVFEARDASVPDIRRELAEVGQRLVPTWVLLPPEGRDERAERMVLVGFDRGPGVAAALAKHVATMDAKQPAPTPAPEPQPKPVPVPKRRLPHWPRERPRVEWFRFGDAGSWVAPVAGAGCVAVAVGVVAFAAGAWTRRA